ncbi:MAG: lysophospholipid acyltransferase family protein [Pseudomonadota bacterium]
MMHEQERPPRRARDLLASPRDMARWAFWVPFRDALDPRHPERLRRLWPLWRVAYRAGGLQRARVGAEIATVLGRDAEDPGVRALVRETYRVTFRAHLEELLLGKLTAHTVDAFLDVRGREHLEAALARGRGAIVLSAHAGSFMLPIAWFSLHGYPYTQFAARGLPPGELAAAHPEALHRNHWLAEVIRVKESHEDQLPASFLTVDAPARELYRRLARNELVALAFDGRMGNRWVRAPLLGRTALLNPGAFRLATNTGAAILPALCRTPADGRSVCQLGPPLLPDGRTWEALMAAFLEQHADPWLRANLAEYGTWLAHCRVRAPVDDHPLFVDYAVDGRWQKHPSL